MSTPACAACGDKENRLLCNLYSVTKGQQAIRELVGAMHGCFSDHRLRVVVLVAAKSMGLA
jgi:hypothetical protein